MAVQAIALFLILVALVVAFFVIWRGAVKGRSDAETRVRELEKRMDDKQRELDKNFRRLNRAAVDRLVAAERERIMREMHDGMGGNLVSTLAMLESGNADRAELSEAIRSCLDDMRLVIDSLDPDVDDIPTLLAMVRCRLEPRLRRRGLRFDWKVRDLPELEGMGPEQYLHILRIVQESITNVMKHTEASLISVATVMDDDGEHAVIEVQDDGDGIAEQAAGGRGLSNMRHRAGELGGRISVTANEVGTLVALTIPIRSEGSTTRTVRHQTLTDHGR